MTDLMFLLNSFQRHHLGPKLHNFSPFSLILGFYFLLLSLALQRQVGLGLHSKPPSLPSIICQSFPASYPLQQDLERCRPFIFPLVDRSFLALFYQSLISYFFQINHDSSSINLATFATIFPSSSCILSFVQLLPSMFSPLFSFLRNQATAVLLL